MAEKLQSGETKRSVRSGFAQKDAFLPMVDAFLTEHAAEKWCVAAVDIEHFKLYNEWYGLAQGDALLEAMAVRLAECAARYGSPVGYFGNDDFFLLMPDDDAQVRQVQNELQRCVDENQKEISFWVVLGLCPAPLEGVEADAQALCNYAQIAASRHMAVDDNICRFESAMLDKMLRRQQQMTELEGALERREFFFYLQPKCNSLTHAIVGMEALARWNHPTRGVVSPGEFVPILESTGLIARLDRYIWEEVCKMLHVWKQEKRNLVPISVNVSMADIAAMDVPNVFAQMAEKYELEPKLLPVEITESMLAENPQQVNQVVTSLHCKGFSVLMDDFGSGYSSLNMLKDISVDVIKLDVNMLEMTHQNREKGVRILQTVVDLAQKLDLPIVAEGVETQEQVALLQSMDCLYSQGYYFFRPMPVECAEALLEQPATESYWDVQRDLMRRNRLTPSGGRVSEQAAAALHAYQIFEDSVLVFARLNLSTGEQITLKRDPCLEGGDLEGQANFTEYSDWLVEKGIIFQEDIKKFKARMNFERLRDELFTQRQAVYCRFREKMAGRFVWLTMEIQPAQNCSPQNPWAVLIVREDTQVNQLSQELLYSYSHDVLTGLYNRNKFEMDSRDLRCSDYRSMACVYIDVIGLHEINNYLGHEQGDEMLRCMARAMRRSFPHGMLYRIGGDEFVALLPNSNFYEAWSQTDQMRSRLKKHDYEVSVGIQVAREMTQISKTIEQAETAMRQEKQSYYDRNGKARQLRGLNEKLERVLAEKRDAENFLCVLAPRFKGVYIVDMNADKMRSIYIPTYFKNMMAEADGRYSSALRRYGKTLVAPAYHELFFQLCNYDYLRARLRTGEVIENVYQKVNGESIYVMVMNYSFDFSREGETLWIFSDEAIMADSSALMKNREKEQET